jgi:hypothetical protein
MADSLEQKEYKRKKNRYYIIAYTLSYIVPFLYFFVKLGITKQTTSIIVPTVFIGFLGIMKLARDIPDWVKTWEPSLKKGLIKAIPKVLLFIILVTFGLTLRYMLIRSITVAFNTYFETVFVLFGGMALGAIFAAFHLKYKELYLMSKGYVLGTVNK